MTDRTQIEKNVGVIGAGAWGLALALSALRANNTVTLWGRTSAAFTQMKAHRHSPALPGIALPNELNLVQDVGALKDGGIVLLCLPAQALAKAMQNVAPHLPPRATYLIAAKGLDLATRQCLSDLVKPLLPAAQIGVLSGPSFASDVARGLPTAVTIAVADSAHGAALCARLSSDCFRPYYSADLRGVELGGALKNPLSIAAGIVMGRGLGESARAALIARGFAEMQRFGTAFGGQAETFAGLSGLGDLALSATSAQSRNYRFGLALGAGEKPGNAQQALGTVEGAWTALAAADMAKSRGIDAPIISAVAALVSGTEKIETIIAALMRRPLKAE